MPAANDIRKGNVIKYNNEPCLVMDLQHRTPGNLRAFVQAKLRNLRSGATLDKNFISGDRVQDIRLDHQTVQYLYRDEDFYHFMSTQFLATNLLQIRK